VAHGRARAHGGGWHALYVTSGYGLSGGKSGNVLLAFALGGD